MYRFKFHPGKTALMLLQKACGATEIEHETAIITVFEQLCNSASIIPIIKSVRAFGIKYHTKYEDLKIVKDLVDSYGCIEVVTEDLSTQSKLQHLESIIRDLKNDLLDSERELIDAQEKIQEQTDQIFKDTELITKLQEDDRHANISFQHMNAMIDEKSAMIEELQEKLTALELYIGIKK